jgi:hypothetical protein
MEFEKIMQSLFPGRGGDRMSLARRFNAGDNERNGPSRGSDG